MALEGAGVREDLERSLFQRLNRAACEQFHEFIEKKNQEGFTTANRKNAKKKA